MKDVKSFRFQHHEFVVFGCFCLFPGRFDRFFGPSLEGIIGIVELGVVICWCFSRIQLFMGLLHHLKGNHLGDTSSLKRTNIPPENRTVTCPKRKLDRHLSQPFAWGNDTHLKSNMTTWSIPIFKSLRIQICPKKGSTPINL